MAAGIGCTVQYSTVGGGKLGTVLRNAWRSFCNDSHNHTCGIGQKCGAELGIPVVNSYIIVLVRRIKCLHFLLMPHFILPEGFLLLLHCKSYDSYNI